MTRSVAEEYCARCERARSIVPKSRRGLGQLHIRRALPLETGVIGLVLSRPFRPPVVRVGADGRPPHPHIGLQTVSWLLGGECSTDTWAARLCCGREAAMS
jgi:redox-sensitive bicupin YhaK (pirin superfamily)